MVFNAIEIIALIFAIVIIVKLLIVSFSPRSWWGFAKGLYKTPAILFIVELILAIVVFYYLLQQLAIVQIMAAVTFGALLTGLSFTAYAKETLDLGDKILRSKTLVKRIWLPIVIWFALAVWVLIALF